MTAAILQGYQWAAGFNNAAGLKNVETDVLVFQNKAFYVHGLGSWNEGLLRTRGDKTVGAYGFQRVIWVADVMSDAQYNYIQATYTSGGAGFSAQMTIRTLNRASSFANYSAVLRLPKKADLDRIWNAYRNVLLAFVIEAAL